MFRNSGRFHVDNEREGLAASNGLLLLHAQQLTHFFVEEALSWTIGLYPFAVDYELRNSTFANVLDELVCRARRALDVDFVEGNIVFLEEVLGLTAIATPERGVNGQIHPSIVTSP